MRFPYSVYLSINRTLLLYIGRLKCLINKESGSVSRKVNFEPKIRDTLLLLLYITLKRYIGMS